MGSQANCGADVQASSPSPLPPLCCAERSPFPASRGRMKMRRGGKQADLAVQSRYETLKDQKRGTT
jgi:hypothetical protein